MVVRSAARFAVSLAFAAAVLAPFAPAVQAETTIYPCGGTCGSYDLFDDATTAGVNCYYERRSKDLDSLSIRPPQIFGSYAEPTMVDWRFRILRATTSGTNWNTILKSTFQSAMADADTPAMEGSGFTRRPYIVAENPHHKFKVRIELRWWKDGAVEGHLKLEYDFYRKFWRGNLTGQR